jgi:uncharacterized protein YjbI with pentapeptide repeats
LANLPEAYLFRANLMQCDLKGAYMRSDRGYSMFERFKRYPWVLDTYYYDNFNEVLASVEDKVVSPAETKVRELSS